MVATIEGCPRRRPVTVLFLVMLTLLATSAWSSVARAQATIRHPGERTPYRVELEPHALATPFDPPGPGAGSGFGLGFRGAVEIVSNGFIPRLNNSVAIGFGADWVHYPGHGDVSGRCTRYEPAPAGTRVYVDVDAHRDGGDYLFTPVVLQWNFWLHRRWSAFGEPGLGIYWRDNYGLGAVPMFFVGGRYHFSERAALTMRIGYPAASIGVSFFL